MERDSQHMRVTALVLSVGSFFLFIAAETLQYEGARAHRVVLTLVALGALGFAWIGPLTLLAGSLRSPAFKWWQPFEGGVEFAFMQAFGWSLDALVLTASAVVLANYRVREWFQGLYLLLGVTGFSAQILLNLSLSSFREGPPGRPEFQFPLNTKAIVSLLISTSATLMFMVYDACAHLLQSSVIITLACSLFMISSAIIHIAYGCREIPGYRFWQPFEGDRMFLLLQYLGWQFLAGVIAGSLILCVDSDSTKSNSSTIYSVGPATTLGLMGLVSQVLLLVSIQFFRSDGGNDAAPTSAVNNNKNPPEVFVAALLIFSALTVSLVSYSSRTIDGVAKFPAVQTFLQHERIWWAIGTLAIAIATPIAQMGAIRLNQDFHWWQPFIGGTRFVFLQTMGWFWYGVDMALMIVLWMNSRYVGEPVSVCVFSLGAASTIAIALSLSSFKAPPRGAKIALSSQSSPHAAKTDVALFLIFALTCASFHVLVDVFHNSMAGAVRVLCVALGTGASVVGCGIAQISGRRYFPSYRFWQPFEGGTRFVVRQAVGWSLFAVQLLFDSLLLTIIAWQRAPSGVPSLMGVFSLVPHFLIASSITHFREPTTLGTVEPRRKSATTSLSWRELCRDIPIRWRLAVNVVIAIGSMILFVSAEIVHGNDRIQHAEQVLYLFGFLSSLCGMIFGHCILATKMHASYRLFQPFRGGIRFVTLQGAAWTLMSMGWAVACTVLYWSDEFFRVKGIHLLTGVQFFVAQVLLLQSLVMFKPQLLQGRRFDNTKSIQTGFRSQAEDWINQFLVGPLLGIAGCFVFVLVDLGIVYFGPSVPVFPMTVCAVLALFSSIPMSYSIASSSFGIRAKAFSGSIVFVVAGCALWSFTLLLAVVYSYNLWALETEVGDSLTRSKSPTAFMGTFTGMIGFIAQLLVLQAPDSRTSRHSKDELWTKVDKSMLLIEQRAGYVAVWAYSGAAVAAWTFYCYVRAMIPRQLATSQIFSLLVCTAVVICSACWIQQHILSGCEVMTDRELITTRVTPLDSPNDGVAALRIGVDCYIHLALLLSVSDVVALSKSCRAIHGLLSENFWRQVFRHRLQQKGLPFQEQTKLMQSFEVAYPSWFKLQPPAALSSLTRVEDSIFKSLCRLEHPQWTSFTDEVPGIRLSKWKALYLGNERTFSLKQCFFCHTWELSNIQGHHWEIAESCSRRAPSTWITVCSCQSSDHGRSGPQSAHRYCAEKLLLPRGSSSPLLRPTGCVTCIERLVEDIRLPASLSELLAVTWKDIMMFRQDFGGGFLIVVPSCSAVLSTTLRSFGWESLTFYSWVTLAVAICFVAHSPWFDARLQRLGGEDSPTFLAYQRLYHSLVMSSIAHVTLCSPYVSVFTPERSTIIRVAATLFFYTNFCFLLVVGVATLIVYWRAHYPLQTLREVPAVGSHSDGEVTVDEEPGSCIMCQLLVCSMDR